MQNASFIFARLTLKYIEKGVRMMIGFFLEISLDGVISLVLGVISVFLGAISIFIANFLANIDRKRIYWEIFHECKNLFFLLSTYETGYNEGLSLEEAEYYQRLPMLPELLNRPSKEMLKNQYLKQYCQKRESKISKSYLSIFSLLTQVSIKIPFHATFPALENLNPEEIPEMIKTTLENLDDFFRRNNITGFLEVLSKDAFPRFKAIRKIKHFSVLISGFSFFESRDLQKSKQKIASWKKRISRYQSGKISHFFFKPIERILANHISRENERNANPSFVFREEE